MSIDVDALRAALPSYERVLAAQAETRKSSADLVALDAWYRGALRRAVEGRDDGHLTFDELSKLMKWKLALIATNSEDAVTAATSTAYTHLKEGDPAKALKAVTVLKAVGPATGSAILSLQAPSTQAFMSDEAVEALGGIKGDYTIKGWSDFRARIERALERWEGEAEELEQACYALIAGKRLGVTEGTVPPKKKRKRA